ncbi:hypothetical protein [Pseudonocardia alni]|uniref:hypothetical protein n=1 Tax=Pseudonocardia alni TaxID=33907 RepID=UPI00332C83DF
MSAPAVHIPSPRRPLGAAPATPSVPAPRAGGTGRADRVEGRHRRREDHVDLPAPRRERPRSTSPQAPGIPAPRPASPGSSAGRPGPAAQHPAVPAPRPAGGSVPAPRRTGTTARPLGDTPARGPVAVPAQAGPAGVAQPAAAAGAQRRTTGTPAPTGTVPHGVRPGSGQPHAVGADREGAVRGRTGGPSAVARTLDVLGRVGSITTIAAMLVLSAALAGLADGTPPSGAAAEVAVTTLR